MKPKYNWGELMWAYIHTICIIDDFHKYNVVIQISKNIILLLKSIKLPCNICQIEFTNELHILSENINDKVTKNDINNLLFYWSVDFHNKINLKLNKDIISYDKAKDLWLM